MLSLGLALAACALTDLFAGSTSSAGARTSVNSPSGAVTCDEDGWRYSYHLPTGAEGLFDLRTDPCQLHDLLRERPDVARRLRRGLESRLHVESLEALRAEHAETTRRLRSLGYL